MFFNLGDLTLNWWPWLNLWSDSFLLQLLIFYTFFLIYFSTNIYYVLFYFFLLVMYFGFFLCIYQIELFTGFLWLVECVAIFIFLLFLFFLKTHGTWSRLFAKAHVYTFACISLNCFLFFVQPTHINFIEGSNLDDLNALDIWDNFYEAINNTNVNDFIAFLISYYTINSHLLIVLGFIILIATLICVNLNKIIRLERMKSLDSFLKLYKIHSSVFENLFMRQQNLIDQENQPTGSRIFKKKIQIFAKKPKILVEKARRRLSK